jgi:hypothetical protein
MRRFSLDHVRYGAVAAIVFLCISGAASQALAQSCAMCAASFGPDDPVQRAFSWSILFMMAAPYTIFGSIAAWLFFSYRRAPGRRRARIIDLARLRHTAPAGSGGDVP